MKLTVTILLLFSFAFNLNATTNTSYTDSVVVNEYQLGSTTVNNCTPWHHLKCVAITGTEVFEDGRDGKKVRHWWRMSYIGQACSEKHGKVFGKIFEGFFAVPHYTGVLVGSSFGYLIYAFRGPRDLEKVKLRKQKRNLRKNNKLTTNTLQD